MHQTEAEQLLQAITTRDFAALEATLEPNSQMRALLPSGVAEETSAAGVANRFRQWFGTLEVFEVLDAKVETTGDRSSLQYRLRARWPGEDETVISQNVVLMGTGGAVEMMHLVCTGFRPIPVPLRA